MLVALLAMLGVNLMVLVAFLVALLARKRWLTRRQGAFRGAVRVRAGEHVGMTSKWRRGYGYWVRDVLVWTEAPLLVRTVHVATDDMVERRPAGINEVKRLGKHPTVILLMVSDTTLEVAARHEDTDQLTGPYSPARTNDQPSGRPRTL
ncbi:hypothetical protein [Williamsia sp. R60]